MGTVPLKVVEVTAADRAAATIAAWGSSSVMRVAHDSSFCGRGLGGSAPVGARRGLSDRPATPSALVLYLALAGRGGSVSRRDHNQAAGNRAHSQAEPIMKKGTSQTPAALRERGSGGEGLLSEKPPLPQSPPKSATSLEKGARGRGLFFRKGLSLANIHNLEVIL